MRIVVHFMEQILNLLLNMSVLEKLTFILHFWSLLIAI